MYDYQALCMAEHQREGLRLWLSLPDYESDMRIRPARKQNITAVEQISQTNVHRAESCVKTCSIPPNELKTVSNT